MPDKHSSGLEHACELADSAHILRGMGKETKRCKEIQHRIEPSRPSSRHFSHVAARVAKVWPTPALAGDLQQFARIVETVDIVARLREQVRVSSLSTRDVQDPRGDGKAEQIHETRCFLAIALGGEEETVFQEIVGIEGRLPPLDRFLQKKT